MIANPNSRSPGSIPNNRCETLAPPVPTLHRATSSNRRVPSLGKRLGASSHVTIASFLALPAPRPGTPYKPHKTRVNRTSCGQNALALTLASPLPARRKSTFRSPGTHQPPTPLTVKTCPHRILRQLTGEPVQSLAFWLNTQSRLQGPARPPHHPHSKIRGVPGNRFGGSSLAFGVTSLPLPVTDNPTTLDARKKSRPGRNCWNDLCFDSRNTSLSVNYL